MHEARQFDHDVASLREMSNEALIAALKTIDSELTLSKSRAELPDLPRIEHLPSSSA